MKLKGGMQKKRGSEVHVEGAIEFQHGDDIQRWWERGCERRVDQRIKKWSMVADAQELGSKLAKQCRSQKPEALIQDDVG